MAEQTGIEWCDATFNPWWGCEKVSPGCAHCYADTLARRRAPKLKLWGDGHEFRFFGDKHWAEPLKWARLLPAKLGRRPRVFCASMADVFEERDELQMPRHALFELIEATPELDWLVLTKRPEFARDWLFHWDSEHSHARSITRDDPEPAGWGLPPNLWMGVSIENSRFTWRADVLCEIPAAVRFLSCEPLLGSLFESRVERVAGDGGNPVLPLLRWTGKKPLDLTGIDWVIVGGESGPGARPMQLQWAREIRDAVLNTFIEDVNGGYGTGAALFVKQFGAKPMVYRVYEGADGAHGVYDAASDHIRLKLRDRKGGDWTEWPDDLRIREFPASAAVLA